MKFMSSHYSCSILYKPMVTILYDAIGVNEWVTPGTPYQPRFTCYWALETNDSLKLRYQMAAVQ